jgi:hypothetical protein
VGEDLAGVYADIHYQEIAYGFTAGPGNVSSPATAGLIEQAALAAAREDVAHIPPERRSSVFRELKLGREPISGPRGRVPSAMIGEYATQAYLLIYSMVERSLGARSARVLAARQTRAVFRHPPRVVHAILNLNRREQRLAGLTLASVLFAGLGGFAAWWLTAGPLEATLPYWYVPGACVLTALAASLLLRWLTRRRRKPCFDVPESKKARAASADPAPLVGNAPLDGTARA